MPVFPAAFHHTQTDKMTNDFHRQMWGLLFLVLVLQAGEPGMELGSLTLQGGPL